MELELRTEALRRAAIVKKAMGAELRARQRARSGDVWRPDNTYATGRRPCVRWMALDLLRPEDRGEIDDNGLVRMERGNERERSIIIALQRAGERAEIPFEIIEGQKRFEVTDKDGVVILTGKIDGKIKFRDNVKATFDTKAGDSFRFAKSVEDLLHNPWTWASVWQICTYLLREAEPFGYLVLDRSGLPEMVPIILEEHLGEVEGFLQEARLARNARHDASNLAAIEAGQWPMALPAYTDDPALCRRCPHLNKSCTPPTIRMGEGVTLIQDEDLIQAAETYFKTEVAATENDRSWKKLTASLRGIEHGILGPFEFTGRWQKQTSYAVPDEVRNPYKTVDPKGKFALEIHPLAATPLATENGESQP